MIKIQCSDFLTESEGIPLLKNLPIIGDDVRKVKLRKKKNKKGEFVTAFNNAIERDKLLQTCMFANGPYSFSPIYDDVKEPFYVFPINGYIFLYIDRVTSIENNYNEIFDILQKDELTAELFPDVLKEQCNSDNIFTPLITGSELLIYNIQYYYAIRVCAVGNYDKLLNDFPYHIDK